MRFTYEQWVKLKNIGRGDWPVGFACLEYDIDADISGTAAVPEAPARLAMHT